VRSLSRWIGVVVAIGLVVGGVAVAETLQTGQVTV
jgi:hypothetical protein